MVQRSRARPLFRDRRDRFRPMDSRHQDRPQNRPNLQGHRRARGVILSSTLSYVFTFFFIKSFYQVFLVTCALMHENNLFFIEYLLSTSHEFYVI